MGYANVDQMLAGMTSRQMAEWRAFGALEPIGDERADYRMAYALSVIVNLLADPEAGPVSPVDLMPRFLGDQPYRDRLAEPAQHPTVREFERMMAQ